MGQNNNSNVEMIDTSMNNAMGSQYMYTQDEYRQMRRDLKQLKTLIKDT